MQTITNNQIANNYKQSNSLTCKQSQMISLIMPANRRLRTLSHSDDLKQNGQILIDNFETYVGEIEKHQQMTPDEKKESISCLKSLRDRIVNNQFKEPQFKEPQSNETPTQKNPTQKNPTQKNSTPTNSIQQEIDLLRACIEFTVVSGQGMGFSPFHYMGMAETKEQGLTLFFLSDEAAILAPYVTRIMFVHSIEEIERFRQKYPELNAFISNTFNSNTSESNTSESTDLSFCVVPFDFDSSQLTLATHTPMGVESPTTWTNPEPNSSLGFDNMKQMLFRNQILNDLCN